MENSNSSAFTLQKQTLLVEYLLSSPDTFALTQRIIQPSYFDPSLRPAVGWIQQYFNDYNSLPSPAQVLAETDVSLSLHTITKPEIKYCSTEIAKFCKRKAVEAAIIAAPTMIRNGDYGAVEALIRDAISISLNSDLGTDYFTNPLDRLEDMLMEAPRLPLGFGKEFDDAIGGGLARTEMLLFTANSGGGKSIMLGNVALNMAAAGLNVVYISLELSENMISQRFDQMITGIPQVIWRNHHEDIAEEIVKVGKNAGNLTIVRMPTGSSANDFRAYLKEYELKHGFVPDALIVDYLDLMGPNEKMTGDNVSEKDKKTSEQLRDIGFDYNMYIATASQQNRSAIDATEASQSHIAGGLTKINTTDISVSIILTPAMKAIGEIGFTFTKTRSSDGVGKTVYAQWLNKYLRVVPPKDTGEEAPDPVKTKYSEQKKGPKKSLDDVFAKYA